ncbi:alpha-mannosidase, partial [Tanacetum coccineum]
MWTMGDDFQYQYAESWFKEMDKLIHYVNKDGRVNALYSTPSIYTDAKLASNVSWPLKIDDYFPYADGGDSYWTGYFTSRPALKGYIRSLSGYYLAARQLEFLVGRRLTGPDTFSLGDALGIAQHHDAVTGTAKQHTTNDYEKRLAVGAIEAEVVVTSALSCLTSSTSNCTIPTSTLSQVVVAYNPLGWNRRDYIRIPVKDANVVVQDSEGNTVEAQLIKFNSVTSNLRSFYTEAYLGISPQDVPKYWLLFRASVPPLGWNTYFVTETAGKAEYVSMVDTPQNDTIEIGPGSLKMSFSSKSGQLKRITNSRTGIDLPVQQSYLWYGSAADNQVPIEVIRGPLVDEVHQQFNPWIYQVTRLYKDKEHAEFEFIIGPVPTDDGVGKEVITRITANMATNKVLYTDSNGRDFLKRVRNYREDWPLQVTQPVAGNYYPLNLGMYATDNKTELSMLVDRATGGASINDGQMEVMLHRRILYDDGRGVDESLDETVCNKTTCQGLAVRGNYYMSVDQAGSGSRWRRTTGQEIVSPLLLAFTHEELTDGNVLLRLAHLYEAGEDVDLSTIVKVELKKMFAAKT